MVIPFSDKSSIREAIFIAVRESFANINQHEPQLVANLVYKLTKEINECSSTKGLPIFAGGVFIHARPLVSSKLFPQSRPKSVEIGDLLLIRKMVENGRIIEQQALLLQVKKTSKLEKKPDNKNQWSLYSKWSEFEYAKGSGSLTGKKRHIIEPDMYNAAKYMFIMNLSSASTKKNEQFVLLGNFCCAAYFFCENIHLVAQPSSPELSHYNCFLCELFNFFMGNAGKNYIDPPSSENIGWDQVIYDLTHQTADMVSKFMEKAGDPSGKRGQKQVFIKNSPSKHSMFYKSGNHGNNNLPPVIEGSWPEDPDDNYSGISIIEVITGVGKEE